MERKSSILRLGLGLILLRAASAWSSHTKLSPEPARLQPAPSAEETSPLQVGAKVPDVSLKSSEGLTVRLLERVREKPTVLIFYRGGWCPYCNTHLGKLQTIEPQLLELGYPIVAISPDRPEKLQASLAKQQLNYQLLSDSKMAAALAFGLAFKVDEATLEKYKGYGIDLEEASGENHHLLPVPAAYVVGTDGVVQFKYANPDYKTRIEPDALLSAAKSPFE